VTSLATELVLFDLDGTLIDSAFDIATAANCALADLGLPPRDIAEVQTYIGNGAEILMHRCLTGEIDGRADTELHRNAYQRWQLHYGQCLLDRTQPYPGVAATLQTLAEHHVRLGCVTNKPARFCTAILDGLALARYFTVALGGDSLPVKKPDPTPLLHAAAVCGATPRTTVMVGDSLTDLRAARAATMRIVCVDYGYSRGIDLASYSPDAVVSSFPEILGYLLT
jgi:phosphoglycolate phosphatase